MTSAPYGLFQAYGLELEYMIVDRALNVAPLTDQLLSAEGGPEAMQEGEAVRGAMSWSNELVLHVLEIKNAEPVPSLAGLAGQFQAEVARANELLAGCAARLMPTGMHPWMDPEREMRLWPHSYHQVYAAFDRVFNCRGHGWANLQSVHLNLPFRSDDEFARLHAAVRLLLPILPALSASSPVCEGQVQPWLDYRMRVYMTNARRIAAVTGAVVPESVSSREEYQQQILAPMYRAVAPFDPEGVLQHEWLNARGAVAKFSRHSLEIRVLDVQECPRADVAVCAAICSVLEDLVAGRHAPLAAQQQASTERLASVLGDVTRDADHTVIEDADYLQRLGYPKPRCRADDLWRHLLDETARRRIPDELLPAVDTILDRGTLARRIVAATGPAPSAEQLHAVYDRLCQCLASGTMLQ